MMLTFFPTTWTPLGQHYWDVAIYPDYLTVKAWVWTMFLFLDIIVLTG